MRGVATTQKPSTVGRGPSIKLIDNVRKTVLLYRTIDASFWTDPKVLALSCDSRLILLYLITNPHSHVGGIYHLQVAYMCADTGIADRVSRRILDTLSDAGFIHFDDERSIVWVVNMFRYQGRGEKNERSVANQLESLHGSPLIDAFLKRYPTVQKYLDEPPVPRRGKISNTIRFRVLSNAEFKCSYCGASASTVAIEVDHILAVANGGTDDESNLIAACWTCNNGKSDTLSEIGTPNRIRTEQDQNKDQDSLLAIPSPVVPIYKPAFEQFWSQSTRRGSKFAASKAWDKIRPDEALSLAICAAMAKWKLSEQWQDESKQPHGATWLNRRGWEEDLPMRRVAVFKPNGHAPPIDHPPALHPAHVCESCEAEHVWICLEPSICGMPHKQTCPQFAARFAR